MPSRRQMYNRRFGAKGALFRTLNRGSRKLATVKKVKQLIEANEEKKHVDVSYDNSTPLYETGVVVPLQAGSGLIPQGDDDDEREGNIIKVDSIRIKGYIQADVDATEDTLCRFMIIRGVDSVDGTLPAITDFLETDNVVSFTDWDNHPQWQVLYDKIIRLPYSNVASRADVRTFKYYKKWKKNRLVHYTGTAGEVANMGKGHYFAVMITDKVTTKQPNWTWNARTVFTD